MTDKTVILLASLTCLIIFHNHTDKVSYAYSVQVASVLSAWCYVFEKACDALKDDRAYKKLF